MKTYTLTFEQLNAIESALTLAQYFVDDQEPSNECHKEDSATLSKAYKALEQIFKPE